jgi:vacuolar-type H+-ATPase subunit H
VSAENGSELGALDVVNELEDLVSGARRVPLSANVIVNEDETLELIDRLRMSLPDELTQARHTLDDRDRLVATAHDEAEKLLSSAEQQAERLVREAGEHAAAMVAQDAVLQQAQVRAAQILTEAEQRANSIRGEADAYARDVMQRLEEQLMRTVTTVRKGIEALPAQEGSRRKRKGEGDR